MRRGLLFIAVVLAAIVLAWIAIPHIRSLVVPSRFAAVRVASISFYSDVRPPQCVPLSRRVSTFPASTPRIYHRIVFGAWHGRRTVRIDWYSPPGQLFDSLNVNNRDVSLLCVYINVYGDRAATLTGRWHVEVSAGGHTLRSASFRIRPVQPDPNLLVSPLLCRHSCTAQLQSPDGVKISKRFPARQALVQYLRWHPGTRVGLIVGNSV